MVHHCYACGTSIIAWCDYISWTTLEVFTCSVPFCSFFQHRITIGELTCMVNNICDGKILIPESQ